MTKGRIEAFSDGVIAVAITLLALDLHVPDPVRAGSLAARLDAQWPSYAAYVVSFLTIGIIWINHHAMLRRLASVDHAVLILNLVLLLTIGVLPFSTALMADYLTASHGQNLAAVIYGCSFLAMSLAFFALHRHLLVAKSRLLHQHLTPDRRRAVLRRNATGLAPYSAATLGGIITPYATLAICAAVAVFYALPATTADTRKPATPTGNRATPAMPVVEPGEGAQHRCSEAVIGRMGSDRFPEFVDAGDQLVEHARAESAAQAAVRVRT